MSRRRGQKKGDRTLPKEIVKTEHEAGPGASLDRNVLKGQGQIPAEVPFPPQVRFSALGRPEDGRPAELPSSKELQQGREVLALQP